MVRKRTKHDANLTGRTTFFGEHPMDKLSQKPKKYPPTKSWKSWHEKGSFRVKVWKFTVASDFFSHIVLLPFFPFTSMIFRQTKSNFSTIGLSQLAKKHLDVGINRGFLCTSVGGCIQLDPNDAAPAVPRRPRARDSPYVTWGLWSSRSKPYLSHIMTIHIYIYII